MSRRRGRADAERLGIDLAAFKADHKAGVLYKVMADRHSLPSAQSVVNLAHWMGLPMRRNRPRSIVQVLLKLPIGVHEALRRRARAADMPLSTYTRNLIAAQIAATEEKTNVE